LAGWYTKNYGRGGKLSFRLNPTFGRQSLERGGVSREGAKAAKCVRRRRSKGRAGMLRVWVPTHWLGWLSVKLWAALRLRARRVLENLALRRQPSRRRSFAVSANRDRRAGHARARQPSPRVRTCDPNAGDSRSA